CEGHAHMRAYHGKRVAHICRVADECHVEVFELLSLRGMLGHGEHIAKHLRRMIEVGKAVDDGNGRISGEIDHRLMLQGSRLYHIDHARYDLGSVADGLTLTHMDFARTKIEGVAAKFRHGDLEGDARAGGWLLEDH